MIQHSVPASQTWVQHPFRFLEYHSSCPTVTLSSHSRLVCAALQELRNLAVAKGGLAPNAWCQLTALLALVVAGWRDNERKAAQRKADEDSMFVTR
jgi:hypothetical protein